VTGPAVSEPTDLPAVDDVVFSIVDADTGRVTHNVAKSFLESLAWHAAISPDQRLVAVIYFTPFVNESDRRIGIYSTDNWQRIAAIPLGEEGEAPLATAITFSPDGKLLAVAYWGKLGNDRVDVIGVESWKLIRSIKTFPDVPSNQSLTTLALRFSPDSSTLAVFPMGGGLANRYPNGQIAPKGAGTPMPTNIPELCASLEFPMARTSRRRADTSARVMHMGSTGRRFVL
jgi:hypothetical protein